MKFSIAIVAAALIAGVAADNYLHHDILYDVVQIQNSVSGLSEKLKEVDGTSQKGFHEAQNAVKDLARNMEDATKDIQSTETVLKGPTIIYSLTKAQIISVLTEAYSDLVAAADKLVAIKPNLKKLQYEGRNDAFLLKGDISDLTSKTMWFTIALVAKVPDTQAVAYKYNSKLSATVDQYSDVGSLP